MAWPPVYGVPVNDGCDEYSIARGIGATTQWEKGHLRMKSADMQKDGVPGRGTRSWGPDRGALTQAWLGAEKLLPGPWTYPLNHPAV